MKTKLDFFDSINQKKTLDLADQKLKKLDQKQNIKILTS